MIRSAFSALALSVVLSASTFAAEKETRKFITADSSQGRIAIVNEDGSTAWESKIGPLHDLHVLDDGNILFQTNWTHLVEVDPETDKVVWEYESKHSPGNENRNVEVHAFQRLKNGHTMIAESGATRIIEVDADGKVVKEIPLKVQHPHPHTDTRLVRKLDNGHYLVCQESDGLVREYGPDGQTVWEYKVPLFGKAPKGGHGVDAFGNKCFSAVRLKNGNTLIATGNGHSVIEVTPQKKIVWKLDQNELPNIQLAWVTTLQVLPNGHIVLGNCHAGPDNPQIIEINRDKEVIWSFHDFDRFGNATTNTQMLSVNGKPVKGSNR
jgi:outer membrane protein assembly factor BamB